MPQRVRLHRKGRALARNGPRPRHNAGSEGFSQKDEEPDFALCVIQVNQDLQVGRSDYRVKSRPPLPALGSLSNQVLASSDPFPPLPQLGSPIPRGHDLAQPPLAEIGNRQGRGRVPEELLDLLGQRQQVHDLGNARPRNPRFGGKSTADSPPIELIYFEVLPDRRFSIRLEAAHCGVDARDCG